MELFNGGSDIGLLLLRVFVGAIMVVHGYPKLFRAASRAQTIQFMKSVGVPPALTLSAALIEVVAGLGLVVGLLTPVAAVLVAAEMAGTTVLSQKKLGKKLTLGYELDLAYMFGALTLMFAGPGSVSVDSAVGLVVPTVWVAALGIVAAAVLIVALGTRMFVRQVPTESTRVQQP